ncbi:MAG: carboxy terminal-processing peptidase, partial [Verrucomicrobiota bacterium]
VPDRGEAAWPADAAEADKLWEARLKNDLLNEIIAKLDDLEDEEDAPAPAIDADFLASEAFAEKLTDARADVKRRYERLEKSLLDVEAAYVQERFLTTLTHLFDPHSNFLSADSLEDFAMSMRNSFVGIGAVLTDDDGYCTIRELLPGGPAELSGELDTNDIILAVGDGTAGELVSVVDMPLRKIVKMIKGERGTIVRLQIQPAGAAEGTREVVELVRDEIKLTANLASAEVFELPVGKSTVPIGVIDLPSFYGGDDKETSSTTKDVEELISKLKDMGIEGLVLDLRRNGGGLLNEAVDLTGLFIERGPVVQVKDLRGNIYERFDKDPKVAWSGPLMVLVSRYSASASEIVAGALKDHQRALIVGDSATHGKGTVQAIFEMDNRSVFSALSSEKMGAAKITIQKFYLPSGKSTQEKGVPSDIVLPSVNEFLPIGESDLEHALGWDTIDALPWDYDAPAEDGLYSIVEPALVEDLRLSSEARQNDTEEFEYLKESIEWFRDRRERNEFSLNLFQRKEQLDQDRSFEDVMDERLEMLAERQFSGEEILLDVTIEQEAVSEAAQAGSQAEDEADHPPFDLHLQESLRIMADWIALKRGLPLDAPKEREAVTSAEAKPQETQTL